MKLLFVLAWLPLLVLGVCESEEKDPEGDDREAALAAAMVHMGDAGFRATPGEEYDCGLNNEGLIAAGGEPVRGRCLWEIEEQGQQWIVTFREVWVCDDFAADVEGYPPCDQQTGFHEWELLVDLEAGTVEQLSERGQFPPDYVEGPGETGTPAAGATAGE